MQCSGQIQSARLRKSTATLQVSGDVTVDTSGRRLKCVIAISQNPECSEGEAKEARENERAAKQTLIASKAKQSALCLLLLGGTSPFQRVFRSLDVARVVCGTVAVLIMFTLMASFGLPQEEQRAVATLTKNKPADRPVLVPQIKPSHVVSSVSFSPNGKKLASGSGEGSVKVWNVTTGKELATLFSLNGGQDWLITTPEGYYTGSPNGVKMVAWRVGEIYPAEQFEEQFKRPNLVAKAISREDEFLVEQIELQLASMTLTEAMTKVEEIKEEIAAIHSKVEGEIKKRIATVPKPVEPKIPPKEEFEKKADYQARVERAIQQYQEAKDQYNQNIKQIRNELESKAEAQLKPYKDALALLESREFVLDETEVTLKLGRYDTESETFTIEECLLAEKFRTYEEWSFIAAFLLEEDLGVPIDQAPQLKRSVENGKVRLRFPVRLNTQEQHVDFNTVLIEDLVQDRQFGYPSPRLSVNSEPSGATVLIDGQIVGASPYENYVSLGQHRVQLTAEYPYKAISQTVMVNIGNQKNLSFMLPLYPEFAKARKRGMLWRSAIAPGWGQIYNGDGVGWVFSVLELAAAGGLVYTHLEYNAFIRRYDEAVGDYQRALTLVEIDQTKQRVKETYQNINNYKRARLVCTLATAGMWIGNLVHAYFSAPAGPPLPQHTMTSSTRWQIGDDGTPNQTLFSIAMRF